MSKRRRLNPTTIFDPVHREYELRAEIINIVNTRLFQRLRRLKQLATAHWVWLGATHDRFSHSISVAYLAGYLASRLQSQQPELNITDRQILLVQLAGLLHDVGHGPFSHLFDDTFLSGSTSPLAQHEQRSVVLVQRLLHESSFDYSPEEIAFVQSLIAPSKGQTGFLYHIVANHHNHLDVDKMEYVKRDTRACGLAQGGFDTDTMRMLNAARVIDDEICYDHKVYDDIYNLFQTRYRLHTTVYRHPAVTAIHYMVADAMKWSGLELEKSIESIDRFCELDDTILDLIRHSKHPKTARSRGIIQRIDERRLYKVADTHKRAKPWDVTPTVEQLVQIDSSLDPDLIILDVHCVGFIGKADGHPMDNLRFYDSSQPSRSFSVKRSAQSKLYSFRYCEYWTRIIVREDRAVDSVLAAWQTWKQRV